MKEPKLRFPEFSGNWKQINLSDITSKIGSGKTPCGGRKAYVSSGIPLIRSQNVNNNVVNFNDAVFIDKATDEAMKNSRVITNDVLLNITGASLGRSAVYKEEESANVNQHVCIIRPIEGYNSNFLQLCLASDYGQKQIDFNQAGGGREGLNFQAIGKMSFMIPSNVEQKKIASLFTELDNLIQSAEKELEGYRELKQGMLQKMFPKKGEKVPEIRFPEFTGDWEQRKVSEIADRFDNLRVPVAANLRIPGSTPYYGANGIQDYVEGYTHDGEYILVAEDGASDLKNYPVNYVNGRIWVNNHAHVLQGKEKIANNKFLSYAMSLADIESVLVGGGRAKLNADIMMNLDVAIPSFNEQEKIGTYFSNLDNLITLHQREIDCYKELKKGLLQQMFC